MAKIRGMLERAKNHCRQDVARLGEPPEPGPAQLLRALSAREMGRNFLDGANLRAATKGRIPGQDEIFVRNDDGLWRGSGRCKKLA